MGEVLLGLVEGTEVSIGVMPLLWSISLTPSGTPVRWSWIPREVASPDTEFLALR